MFPLLLVLAAAALTLGRRSPRLHRRLAIIWALVILWSWQPFAALLSGSLEWQYPVGRSLPADAEAIVVLSGGALARDASQPQDLPNPSTYLRCSHAAWLFRNWKPLPILASGGPSGTGPEAVNLAALMGRVLQEKGVPPSMIWLEEESGSTYENAVRSAALLRAKGIRRIVLVTEGLHMPRADRCFRRQGLIVAPAPCTDRNLQFHAGWRQLLPGSSRAMAYNDDSLHEWVGLLWYAVSGKI